MTLILAIDPGSTQSGWCLYDIRGHVDGSGVMPNKQMLSEIMNTRADVLAIERVASYGMSVGRDVFETCEWVGEFRGLWRTRGRDAVLVYRKDVKLHLCGSSKAKDANIRQALLDLFPGRGGGKTPQIGTKAVPGPLYGVSSHAWSALAVAMFTLSRGPVVPPPADDEPAPTPRPRKKFRARQTAVRQAPVRPRLFG